MKIAVVDFSTQFQQRPGAVERMCGAVDRQLLGEVAREHGYRGEMWCRPFGQQDDVPGDAWLLGLFDDADAAGALGYHDVDPDGRPYGRVFAGTILRTGGTVEGPGNSVSVCLSHEAIETFGDPGANEWAAMPDGTLTARELCDAVEGDSYQNGPNEPYVSNFLLPGWFRPADPTAPARYDHMGCLRAPFGMTAGGYLILMRAGRVSQEFGRDYPGWRHEQKRHSGSRTARRLARSAG